jgi:hypothetical protein
MLGVLALLLATTVSAGLSNYFKFLVPSDVSSSVPAVSLICANYTTLQFPYVMAYPALNKIVVSSSPLSAAVTATAVTGLPCSVLQIMDGLLYCPTLDPCINLTSEPSAIHPLSFTLLGVFLTAVVFAKAKSRRPSLPATPSDGSEWITISDDAIYLEEVVQFCSLHPHFKHALIARL